jgi:glutathione S-transferase
VLEVDGQNLAQSNAINRYVGKFVDLYPSDPWQAALCDEAMEAVEDITTKILREPFPSRTAKRRLSAARWSKDRFRN